MKVTKHYEMELCHVLEGYNGGCGNLHGHTYKCEVTVEGNQNGYMVMDFKELKAIMKDVLPDHATILDCSNEETPFQQELKKLLSKYGMKYVLFPGKTTAENMSEYYKDLIQERLPEGLTVSEIKLWETTDSHATA